MSVLLSYVHPDEVAHSFMNSMLGVIEYEAERGRVFTGRFPVRCGPMTIPDGRNLAAQVLLDETVADWLWIVDTDMGFRPDTLERLVAAADQLERPIVGAYCLAQLSRRPDGMGGYERYTVPTLYQREGDGFTLPEGMNYPKDAMVPVAATGAACLLISRWALGEMRAKFREQWFTRITRTPGRIPMGEDLSFFERVRELGLPVYVHTGIRTSHMKTVFYQ